MTTERSLDAVVVGAGFAGLYMLHRLRGLGMSAQVFEAGDGVGGTWYWNRYPGARCDVPTTDYTFSFDPELEKEWTWSEKYATQPEILDYRRFVADRHALRPDIEFSTAVTAARWDEPARQWVITTDGGVATTSSQADGFSSMNVTVAIDGFIARHGPWQRVTPANTAGLAMDPSLPQLTWRA